MMENIIYSKKKICYSYYMQYKIRKLNIRDKAKIRRLEDSSFEKYYVHASDEHLEFILKEGISYGIFIGNKLVAFSDAFFINKWDHSIWIKNLFTKRNLEYNDNTILFGSTFVHKDYRGNGFQYILRSHLMKKNSGCRYLTRIASANKYSRKNIRKLGFKKIFHERLMRTSVSFYYL
jgi:GNAT superfamily N-acetyltransferase